MATFLSFIHTQTLKRPLRLKKVGFILLNTLSATKLCVFKPSFYLLGNSKY